MYSVVRAGKRQPPFLIEMKLSMEDTTGEWYGTREGKAEGSGGGRRFNTGRSISRFQRVEREAMIDRDKNTRELRDESQTPAVRSYVRTFRSDKGIATRAKNRGAAMR